MNVVGTTCSSGVAQFLLANFGTDTSKRHNHTVAIQQKRQTTLSEGQPHLLWPPKHFPLHGHGGVVQRRLCLSDHSIRPDRHVDATLQV